MADESEFPTADGEGDGIPWSERSEEDAANLGRAAGERLRGFLADESVVAIVQALSAPSKPLGEFKVEGSADGGEWRGITPAAGSIADVRAQLSQFVYSAIPMGVHVEGLVLNACAHKGWRKWALRLGMWLLRKSGCEVVRP